jgi:hypothetical protein
MLALARYGSSMTGAEARLWGNIVRLAVIGVGFGTVAWHRRKRRHLEAVAQTWPSVDGWIQCGTVQLIPNTSRYLITLTYSYHVDEYGSGTYTREFPKESDADAFVQQLKDKHVPIRYNPTNPDESVLEDEDILQLSNSVSA